MHDLKSFLRSRYELSSYKINWRLFFIHWGQYYKTFTKPHLKWNAQLMLLATLVLNFFCQFFGYGIFIFSSALQLFNSKKNFPIINVQWKFIQCPCVLGGAFTTLISGFVFTELLCQHDFMVREQEKRESKGKERHWTLHFSSYLYRLKKHSIFFISVKS